VVAERTRERRRGALIRLDRMLLHSPPLADGWNDLLRAVRGARAGQGVREASRRVRPRRLRAMTDDDLESLSSQELHDRAVSRAKHHLDVRFFWELMRNLPAAEAAAGEFDEAEADVMRLSSHIDDLTDSGRGEVADLMRPFYLDYLRRHR
jgi:hypothetical protein